ncbi:BTB/POZ domain-containing protein DOT3-like [Pistacia vera]|uniref:BTB/POZ domain-containing protein DOT3-like n=1 Tax=Pistacia vera TaxID=55513 RepID=UPI001262CAF0|nr:BTB/POZ domain-containing protein DOT3-like [Pistacia vera]XP_031285577.1 BTB/POZ domain-containing protein DOT3-like [Pistacia vera]XP_031285624.1 BTB/POZ domain-containing protein DOT3-like [Pistacia vera]
MKSSSSAIQLRSPGSDSDCPAQAYEQSIVIPNRFIIADSIEKKEHSWFVSSQIPTDLSIQVQDVTFNVHKYPLVSKCGYIGRLELQPSISKFGYDVKLENFPGGPDIFEIILKFCYGLPIDFSPENITPLRCAAEFLDMSEEYEDGNLISKTESFLTLVILSSWKATITVLKSCETLSPWAENLQIVRRCCDSIAWKASRENSTNGDIVNEEGWWFDDVATLQIDHFTRIITAIKVKGEKAEVIVKCIMHYAKKSLPGMEVELEGLRGYGYGKNELQFSILNAGKEERGVGHKEQRMIIESLVSILPPQQEAVSCKFFLQMLKMAIVYSASPALIAELEKRVGMMLEEANVNDLLIPNYKNEDQGKPYNSLERHTMHNTDVVQRIVEYFLMHEHQQQQMQQKFGKTNVSKILDSYLAEIARDPNLSITKFQVLAESLPDNARTCHDGLYRAIDTYLKSHPSVPEHERKRLCKIMNCEKLSLDACTHAAQNDRLPLRTVVQVLFSEQVKMRTAMTRGENSEQDENQSSTSVEIKNLKVELENVKTRMTELQADYSELQQEYEKLSNKQKIITGWSSGWRKIKGSFHSKVDPDETGDRQQRPNSTSVRTSFRRRRSIA